MEIDASNQIRVACRRLLKPIASLLLKCGLTWKEFSDLSKSAFVEAATEDFGIRGRPTNISRVSILTGISRKEVKRQRKLVESGEMLNVGKTTDATRVLSAWHQDPDFLDNDGKPVPIPMRGPAPSFEVLFQRYGGDTPEQTLHKELRNGQSIETDTAGRLVALSRYYMPVDMSIEDIQIFIGHLFDHASTIKRNVSTTNDSEKRYEARATETFIDAAAVGRFSTFVEQRGHQFLEEVDNWLNEHRVEPANNDTNAVRLGAGVYTVDDQLS